MTNNALAHTVTNCTQTAPHFAPPRVRNDAHTAIIKLRFQGCVINKVSRLSWWSKVGSRKATPADDDDDADMGTAFGLDASMAAEDEIRAAPPPDADPEPAKPNDRLNGRSVI